MLAKTPWLAAVVHRLALRLNIPLALALDPDALPSGLRLLLTPARSAFMRPAERAICHGGIALEEVIMRAGV